MLSSRRRDIPDNIWVKCVECGEIIYNGELSRNLRICPKCSYFFPLEPAERIELFADKGTLVKYSTDSAVVRSDDVSCDRAIVTSEAKLAGHRLVIVAIDPMLGIAGGAYVYEKVVRAVSHAVEQRLPLLVCINSADKQSQNGALFPAQALSTSAAMSILAREKLLYISILAQPNSHGHFPGFAYLADIVIMESNLTGGSQMGKSASAQAAQTLFYNGMVDMIISRRESKQVLTSILDFFF